MPDANGKQTEPERGGLRRLGWLAGAALFVGAVVLGVGTATGRLEERAATRTPPEPTPPLPVATASVSFQSSYAVNARYAGRLEAARHTELAFERAGLVMQVAVEQGDVVQAGDLIAELDTVALLARRDRLDANFEQLRARLALAERTAKRRTSLESRGLGSTQSLDEARFDADSIRAEMDAVRADMRVLEIDLAKSKLYAPFAGTIATRRLDEGAIVAPGSAVALLQETARPRARIGVPPAVLSQLVNGQSYTLSAGEVSLAATLRAVRPDLDPVVRTVTALFDVAPSPSLPPLGEVVVLDVREEVTATGAWLPISALKEGNEGLWTVLTVVADDEGALVVAQEAVELLHSTADARGERVFVRGTLQPNAEVIVNGVHRVVSGQSVSRATDVAQR